MGGRCDRQRTLAIRIAAITLASDSAITIAQFRPSKPWKTDLFSSRFQEGISFPNFVERSILEPPLSKTLRSVLCSTEQSTFQGGEKGEKVPRKSGEKGWPATGGKKEKRTCESGSPKPHPSKPRPCNMPQAKTEVALQFSECCAAEVALQHSLFCSAEVVFTKSCAAASEKLQCNIEKAALQESGAFLPLSCGFQAPTFRHPRLGPAE